jgi:thermitase
LKNIISVAALDSGKKLVRSSNWGVKSVDIAAPGMDILSTIPNSRYGKLTGTSQATAFISGVAALILSEQPTLKPEQVISILKSSADAVPELKNKIASGGIINAKRALEISKNLVISQTARTTASNAANQAVPALNSKTSNNLLTNQDL